MTGVMTQYAVPTSAIPLNLEGMVSSTAKFQVRNLGTYAAHADTGVMVLRDPASGSRPLDHLMFRGTTDVTLGSRRYAGWTPRLSEMQLETRQAISSLSSRVDRLAGLVEALADAIDRAPRHTYERPEPSSVAVDGDLASLLDRASDEGNFDEQIRAIADAARTEGDKFTRLAALRWIALSDPAKGRTIIYEALRTEDNAVIAGALQSVLRAIS